MAGDLNVGSQIDSGVSSLQSQLQQAWAHVGMGSVFSDSASDEAIAGSLTQYGKKIEDLDTRLRQQVLSGELSIEKWLAIAATTANGIRDASGYAVGWEDFMSQVVKKTGDDIVADAQAVGSASTPYVIAAIVILGLIFAIKVT